MLRAIIFDFDGVIVDSEPLIMALTQQMAALEGWTVTEEEYYRDYLALDDRAIVEHLYRTHGRTVNPSRRDETIRWKAKAYFEAVHDGLPPLPGAVEFVRDAAGHFPLAIASGSLREEVEYLLGKLQLRDAFAVLSTADDCEQSKPHPCAYLTAMQRLGCLKSFAGSPLRASECLAIEDAPAGVEAAHAAGMRCVAVAHSRPSIDLQHADWVFSRLADADLQVLSSAM